MSRLRKNSLLPLTIYKQSILNLYRKFLFGKVSPYQEENCSWRQLLPPEKLICVKYSPYSSHIVGWLQPRIPRVIPTLITAKYFWVLEKRELGKQGWGGGKSMYYTRTMGKNKDFLMLGSAGPTHFTPSLPDLGITIHPVALDRNLGFILACNLPHSPNSH